MKYINDDESVLNSFAVVLEVDDDESVLNSFGVVLEVDDKRENFYKTTRDIVEIRYRQSFTYNTKMNPRIKLYLNYK